MISEKTGQGETWRSEQCPSHSAARWFSGVKFLNCASCLYAKSVKADSCQLKKSPAALLLQQGQINLISP